MQTFCGLTTDGMYDYLAAIYKLGEKGEKVTTTALAERMHVSPAAASSMLKRLEVCALIERPPAQGVVLLEAGRLAALQLIRRHRLLEVFLKEIMGFTWDQVDAEAHRLEHAISAEFEDRIDRLCNYPTHCPHGDPIPSKDGSMPDEQLTPVLELKPGEQGVLRRVGSTDAQVLRYLGRLNLVPGRRLRLIERAPFNGPVTLDVLPAGSNGHGSQPPERRVLGNELAEQLFVIVGE